MQGQPLFFGFGKEVTVGKNQRQEIEAGLRVGTL